MVDSRMGFVSVRPLGDGDPVLPHWCALFAENLRAESGSAPSPAVLATRIAAEPPDAGVRRWIAYHGSTAAGVAQSNSRDAVFVRLYVAPPYRRGGIGGALLAAVREAHPGRGLKTVTVAGEQGEQFSRVRGATVLGRLVVLEQRLADLPPAPPPADMVFWTDGAPDKLVESYAEAYCALADAPGSRDQLDDPLYDRSRIRRWERDIRTGGHELWVCAAVRDGAVVAFTEIEVGPDRAASQQATVVLPGYRRQGLGAAVKVALAARLRTFRPEVEVVTTTVNEANTAMLALNKRVGYRLLRVRLLLELR